jgi:hypothetical protein
MVEPCIVNNRVPSATEAVVGDVPAKTTKLVKDGKAT